MLSGLRKRYVNFIEKDKRSVPENIFYGFLCFLSWVYGGAVSLRNFFYDKRIIPVYASKAKVVSVGNLSWAGTGKTSLSLWLCPKRNLTKPPTANSLAHSSIGTPSLRISLPLATSLNSKIKMQNAKFLYSLRS